MEIVVIEATLLDAVQRLREGNFYAARELLQEAKREVDRLAVRPDEPVNTDDLAHPEGGAALWDT